MEAPKKNRVHPCEENLLEFIYNGVDTGNSQVVCTAAVCKLSQADNVFMGSLSMHMVSIYIYTRIHYVAHMNTFIHHNI